MGQFGLLKMQAFYLLLLVQSVTEFRNFLFVYEFDIWQTRCNWSIKSQLESPLYAMLMVWSMCDMEAINPAMWGEMGLLDLSGNIAQEKL